MSSILLKKNPVMYKLISPQQSKLHHVVSLASRRHVCRFAASIMPCHRKSSFLKIPPTSRMRSIIPAMQIRNSSSARRAPDFAFAFEWAASWDDILYLPSWLNSIDGVLLRDAVPIPGASKALNYLHDNGIPFILLTNGGGSKFRVSRYLELCTHRRWVWIKGVPTRILIC